MNKISFLNILVMFFPAVFYFLINAGKFIFKFKTIVKNYKAKKLLKKMVIGLNLNLKKSPGGSFFIALRKNDGLENRAISSLSLISDSAQELKTNLVNSEVLIFIEKDIVIKNIFFQKSDEELEILTTLATGQ